MHETSQSIKRTDIIMRELQDAVRNPDEELSDINKFMNQIYYTLDDFLQYDDQTFILYLYIGMLKRHPDQKGVTQWMEQLKNHKKTKREILNIVRFSEEGIAQNTTILGLLNPKKSAIHQIKIALNNIKTIS